MKYFSKKGFWAGVLTLVALVVTATAADQPPPAGGVLPDIALAVPKNPEQLAYLGLKANKTFTVPQVDAEVVIIEVFSMY